MSKIIITKGKLLKNDRLEVEYTKEDGSETKPALCSEKHTAPPHKDLKNAFGSLSIHAALLGEFIALTSVKDINEPEPQLTQNYNVSGFTIIGEDDDEGVILTAQKTLKSGKTLGFNTPIIRFNDESPEAYPHLEELKDCIDTCKDELTGYLNGKHADNAQLKLEM